MSDYEAVIGLEVHAELLTNTKIFCSCTTEFGGEPNSHTCPICLGLPGVLPVLNEQAVKLAVRAGLALNCRISEKSTFDRKNYFYPDLPKGYQITQFARPLAQNGHLVIEVDGRERRIGITRIHLEEDAGKSLYEEGSEVSLVDFNRAGVPLIEIVSEPDIRSSEEAKAYLEKLKTILQYAEVSDCKMNEGSLRCDANISLRPVGSKELFTKTEIKNMNSFRAVAHGLEYEINRQRALLEKGEKIVHETRRYDERRGVTVVMRSKEAAHDYRYFPEPDLLPLCVSEQLISEIRAELPELPDERKQRLMEEYGLPEYDAGVITSAKGLADYFEECAHNFPEKKTVSNWIMGELLRYVPDRDIAREEYPVSPEELVQLIEMVTAGKISSNVGKDVLAEMVKTGKSPQVIIKDKGLTQISGEAELLPYVKQAIAGNPKVVQDYLNGKKQAAGFLVGQVMKLTRGKANPKLAGEIIQKQLSDMNQVGGQ